MVRLGTAFSTSALRLRTGQQLRLAVSKAIQASGPGLPRGCAPGAAAQAISLGLTPFLAGDAAKAATAALLLPAAWKLTGRR